MEDKDIIDLFVRRDEQAIKITQDTYGLFCNGIAMNILKNHEDAEECVNDTFVAAWNRIPPVIPKSLKAYLGRIVRNISLSRYRANHAKKRYSGMEVYLSELDDCIPDIEKNTGDDDTELSEWISEWLESLEKKDEMLFVRRYWYGDSVQDISKKCGMTPAAMAQKLLRLRKSMKKFLEKKGVNL